MDLEKYDMFVDKTATQALLDLQSVHAYLGQKMEKGDAYERGLHERVGVLLEALIPAVHNEITIVSKKLLQEREAMV